MGNDIAAIVDHDVRILVEALTDDREAVVTGRFKPARILDRDRTIDAIHVTK